MNQQYEVLKAKVTSVWKLLEMHPSHPFLCWLVMCQMFSWMKNEPFCLKKPDDLSSFYFAFPWPLSVFPFLFCWFDWCLVICMNFPILFLASSTHWKHPCIGQFKSFWKYIFSTVLPQTFNGIHYIKKYEWLWFKTICLNKIKVSFQLKFPQIFLQILFSSCVTISSLYDKISLATAESYLVFILNEHLQWTRQSTEPQDELILSVRCGQHDGAMCRIF